MNFGMKIELEKKSAFTVVVQKPEEQQQSRAATCALPPASQGNIPFTELIGISGV